ncbi:MAG: hypothetical protein JXR77_02960, partial [Lentisphaeria bacterium]|nr:hypothetical protein [Lentisphaeria bacterium]
YVDDHFYVDHPQFLERDWQLPSRCPNRSPIAAGAPGGTGNCFVRLLDKPFTISEYNYSGPGRFRGVGGILTGCLGAIQDWDVIWRFAYSHSRGSLFGPAPAGYFDIVSDPLNQVAERAAVCLYLRGDLRPAPHRVVIAMDPEALLAGRTPNRGVSPGWGRLAWVTQVATALAGPGAEVPGDVVLAHGWKGVHAPSGKALDGSPYDRDAGERVIEAMRQAGWLRNNGTDLAAGRYQTETGELLIDSRADRLVLDTPATAGGYAPEGETIRTGPVTVTLDRTYGTVWVSSLDGAPIRTSARMLICHLTDLQNTGARFEERARQTLLAWGTLPHLVQDGAATLRLRAARPERAVVYALGTSGRRLGRVAARVEEGELVIPLRVRGDDGKARMLYEIAVE